MYDSEPHVYVTGLVELLFSAYKVDRIDKVLKFMEDIYVDSLNSASVVL